MGMDCYKTLLLCSFLCILTSPFIVVEAVTVSPADGSGGDGGTPGGTQIYPPPPTTYLVPQNPFCLVFDSRRNSSRQQCPLTTHCFSYIRRQTDGSFRVKRGCSFSCENESRNRKIQICCSSHLCNTYTLTPDNFTSAVTTPTPHPQCYQSGSSGTCSLTGICFSRLVYLLDGTYTLEQGCRAREDCQEHHLDGTLQTCCDTHLCNNASSLSPPTPLSTQISLRPGIVAGTSPLTPGSRPSRPLNCSCSLCVEPSWCLGQRCGISVDTVIFTQQSFCVSDTEMCTDIESTVSPGGFITYCCDSDHCNIPLLQTTPTTPTPSMETTRHTYSLAGSTSSSSSSSTPISSNDLYFTFTTVVSVVGGMVVVGIILCILMMLILHIKRRGKKERLRTRSSRQQSPDCHVTTTCYMKSKENPLTSSSSTSTATSTATTSSSGELQIQTDLKYLGTSV